MTERDAEPIAAPADRALHLAENVVYAASGLLLVGAAIATLVAVAYELVQHLDDGTVPAVTSALDGLLLVFILLELLAGVRTTMVERKLVAEPFLIVGIIASIKAIVVIALKADADGARDAFERSMTEIGVLGVMVLLLAAASYLVRRKEREPSE